MSEHDEKAAEERQHLQARVKPAIGRRILQTGIAVTSLACTALALAQPTAKSRTSAEAYDVGTATDC